MRPPLRHCKARSVSSYSSSAFPIQDTAWPPSWDILLSQPTGRKNEAQGGISLHLALPSPPIRQRAGPGPGRRFAPSTCPQGWAWAAPQKKRML